MSTHDRTGLLLINLGTPAGPRPADVRPYLREFLMDERVIDIPAPQRWLLVHLLILPFRPRQSAEAYAKIWDERGSPLLAHGRDLQRKVRQRLGDAVEVGLAMRYGSPSIGAELERLRALGLNRVVVFPLYPQYSSATTGSTLERVFAEAGRQWNVPSLQVVAPFYDHPAFIEACAAAARPTLARADPERVFFSFHGLPERQIRKGDPGGRHCLATADCCARIDGVNRDCYRAQCFATARALGRALGVPESMSRISFQSRLGRTPWIRPYTDELLVAEARSGVKRAVILSPAFVADCLETLEELGMRGVETWQENGGETLALAPCVNADDAWADAVVRIAREQSAWLAARERTVHR